MKSTTSQASAASPFCTCQRLGISMDLSSEIPRKKNTDPRSAHHIARWKGYITKLCKVDICWFGMGTSQNHPVWWWRIKIKKTSQAKKRRHGDLHWSHLAQLHGESLQLLLFWDPMMLGARLKLESSIAGIYCQITPQCRTTFGSWDVEKVHAVVARSTFRSQNVQNTPLSDHFWKLTYRKSARRCDAKSKSKC